MPPVPSPALLDKKRSVLYNLRQYPTKLVRCSLKHKGDEKMNQRWYTYRGLRFVFAPLFRLLFRPRIMGNEHIPPQGAVILAGNHMHALDPILIDISTKRIVRTLAKKDLHDGPFGFIFRAVHTIPVDLHSKHNPAALQAAVQALEQGDAVNVSPEAKRNYTDQLLLPFKYGAVAMSAKAHAPIVPYAIAGTYKPFTGRVTVSFGAPFYASGDLTADNRELYNQVAALLRSVTEPAVLAQKHFTAFDVWSCQHETSS